MRQALIAFLLLPAFLIAQKADDPEFFVKKSTVERQLRFLASDELKGRDTGSEGNNIAGRYIAEQLRSYGYSPAPGQDSYFQTIDFQKIQVPTAGSLKIGERTYTQNEELFLFRGNQQMTEAEAIFANYGWVDESTGRDDYEGLDVEGKLVIVLPGTAEGEGDQVAFGSGAKKAEIAREKGALALIELYRLQTPWRIFKRYFGNAPLSLPDEGSQDEASAADDFLYGWMQPQPDDEGLKALRRGDGQAVSIESKGYEKKTYPSSNIVAVLEGRDPKLKEEYVLLSAHYDHVGTRPAAAGPDSIFNGARDNAMGVVAVLTAARSLAEKKPRRSIVVLACTGEEKGLLGSKYYAENPLVPLNKTIFNANTDGAGYNTTDAISIIGWGRTGTNDAFIKGAEALGLSVIKDPAKEQNLFDRSDNLSFTQKGIPAATISPAFTDFDQEIQKYYHQVVDEADAVDFDYLLKYAQAYTQMVRIIANAKDRPKWVKGDKYEKLGKELYKE